MKLKYNILPIPLLLVVLLSACTAKLPNELYEKAKADAAKDSSHNRVLSYSFDGVWDIEAFTNSDIKAAFMNANLTNLSEIKLPYAKEYEINSKLIAVDNQLSVIYDIVPRDGRSVSFYTHDGEKLSEVLLSSKTVPAIGMDEDYYFYTKQNETTGSLDIYCLPLQDIASKKVQPQLFYSYTPTTSFPGVRAGV